MRDADERPGGGPQVGVVALADLGYNGVGPGSRWRRANLLSLLGYLENLVTSMVMPCYPRPTAVADLLAALFTAVMC